METEQPQTCCQSLLQGRKFFVLVLPLILVAFGLLFLPVMFFYIPVELADNTNQSDSSQHVCLTMASQEHLAANMCKIELPQVFRYHNCSASDSKIALTHVLLDKVDQLQVSEACKSDLNCLYNVSMCDDNGEADQPTLYQCTTSRSATCRNEWNAVLNENIGLLNCSGVPSASPNCNFNKTNRNTTLGCSEGFYEEENMNICLPNCHKWSAQDPVLKLLDDTTLVATSVFGILSSVAVFIVSIIFYKKTFVFPYCLILYLTMDIIVDDLLVLVGFMGNGNLFCSSVNLHESLMNPTPYCVVSGIIRVYIIIQQAYWWLVYILVLFIKVKYPFKGIALQASNKLKHYHAGCVAVGMVVPTLPILIAAVKSAVYHSNSMNNTADIFIRGLGFGIASFPPLMCSLTDSNMAFYSIALPMNTTLAIGLTLLITIFWLIKKRRSKRITAPGHSHVDKPDWKLIIILLYYFLAAVTVSIPLTVRYRSYKPLSNAIEAHFACEQYGHQEGGECSKQEIRRLSYPLLLAAAYIVVSLLPIMNLIYIINIRDSRKVMKNWKMKRERKTSSL